MEGKLVHREIPKGGGSGGVNGGFLRVLIAPIVPELAGVSSLVLQ